MSVEAQRIPAANDAIDAASVDAAIRTRFAARGFKSTPVPQDVIRDILDVARFAPSGANTQPWRVYALAGTIKDAASAALTAAFTDCAAEHSAEYQYYPTVLPDILADRRNDFGRVYYGALQIAQSDTEARARQTAKNFSFFGAPLGLIVTIDRRLTTGSWIDLGMFLQNVMIAAKARGIDTCPQETFARFHAVLRDHLPITSEEIVVCGMSVGYACDTHAAERGVMPKQPVDAFTTFHGFS